jgi:multidrug resistance efflux pump
MANIEVFQYERRRQARKAEATPRPKPWTRRLLYPCLVVAALVVVGVCYWIYWSCTHVTTVRASIGAALVSITSDTDAHLRQLLVEAGQKVTKGQKLAVLDNTEAKAMIAAGEAARDSTQSALTRAQAQLQLTEQSVNADIELARARLEGATARLASDQADLDVRNKRVVHDIGEAEAAYKEAGARFALLKKGSRSEDIAVGKERVKAAKALETLYAYEVEQMQTLAVDGTVSRDQLEQKKAQLSTQRNAVTEAQLDVDRMMAGATKEELEVANQVRAAREASFASAKTATDDLKRLVEGVKVRQAELHEAQAEVKRAETGKAQISLAQENVKAATAELQRAQAEVAARRAAAERMELTSPVSGTVIRTFVNEGELCRKGAGCIQIADDTQGRWIEGFVREVDASYLKTGQKASVEVVLGSGEYVEATISAVGLATSSMNPDESNTIAAAEARARSAELVWVKLVPVKGQTIASLPGMSAQASIRVR